MLMIGRFVAPEQCGHDPCHHRGPHLRYAWGMSVRQLIVAALLGGVFGATISCQGGEFSCASDDQCTFDGAQGWCEGSGFCSFPEPDCPSGREYGEFAGGGLGGRCVPGAESSAGGSDSASDDTTADATTDTTDTSADTSEPPGPCSEQISDQFEDGSLDPTWGVFGLLPEHESWVEELKGAMQVTVPPGADGYAGISLIDLVELTEGRVRFQVEAPPGPATSIILSVGSFDADPGSQLLLYIYESDAELAWFPDGMELMPIGDPIPLSVAETPWVELDFTGQAPGASATLRASEDGVIFTDIVTFEHDVPLSGSVLFLYMSSFDPMVQAGDVVRIPAVEICHG